MKYHAAVSHLSIRRFVASLKAGCEDNSLFKVRKCVAKRRINDPSVV